MRLPQPSGKLPQRSHARIGPLPRVVARAFGAHIRRVCPAAARKRGPPQQAFLRFAELSDSVAPLFPTGPCHPRRLLSICSWWILREIEASNAALQCVSFSWAAAHLQHSAWSRCSKSSTSGSPTSGYRQLLTFARPSVRTCIGRPTSRQWKRRSTILQCAVCPDRGLEVVSNRYNSTTRVGRVHLERPLPVTPAPLAPVLQSLSPITCARNLPLIALGRGTGVPDNVMSTHSSYFGTTTLTRAADLAGPAPACQSRIVHAWAACGALTCSLGQHKWATELARTNAKSLSCASQQYSASSSQPPRHAAGIAHGSASLLRAHLQKPLEPRTSHPVEASLGRYLQAVQKQMKELNCRLHARFLSFKIFTSTRGVGDFRPRPGYWEDHQSVKTSSAQTVARSQPRPTKFWLSMNSPSRLTHCARSAALLSEQTWRDFVTSSHPQ